MSAARTPPNARATFTMTTPSAMPAFMIDSRMAKTPANESGGAERWSRVWADTSKTLSARPEIPSRTNAKSTVACTPSTATASPTPSSPVTMIQANFDRPTMKIVIAPASTAPNAAAPSR